MHSKGLSLLILLFETLGIMVLGTPMDPDWLQLKSIESKKRGSRYEVKVNYTALTMADVIMSSPAAKSTRRPRRHIAPEGQNDGQFSFIMSKRWKIPITFSVVGPNIAYYLYLNTPVDSEFNEAISLRVGPSEDLRYTPPEANDVLFNVTFSTGHSAADVSEEKLTGTSYLKDDYLFREGDLQPVSKDSGQGPDAGTVYGVRVTGNGQPPEGIVVLGVNTTYRSDDSWALRGVAARWKVLVYPEGGSSPVTETTLALVRPQGPFLGYSAQTCDLDITPECAVSCSAVGLNVTSVKLTEFYGDPMENSITTTSFGFLTESTAPVNAAHHDDDTRFGCYAKALADDGSGEKQESQLIKYKIRQAARVNMDNCSAVLLSDETLEVKCKAEGRPLPAVNVTAPDDNSTPLSDRFPNESHSTTIVYTNTIRYTYRLARPEFTSDLRSVTVTTFNGYKEPASVELQVLRD